MRGLVQRVAWAEDEVDGRVVGRIENGLLVYVGVAADDTPEEARWLAEKIAHLRVFKDDQDKLNQSVQDAGGHVLAVSNFTLLADARKGNRPSFVAFLEALRAQGLRVETGVFGARMAIRSQADGPVNVVIDTP